MKIYLIILLLFSIAACDSVSDMEEGITCQTPLLSENFNGNVFRFRNPFDDDDSEIDAFGTRYITSNGEQVVVLEVITGFEYIPDIAYRGDVTSSTEFLVNEALVHQSFLQIDENDPFAFFDEELDVDSLSAVGVSVPASGTVRLGNNQQLIILENIVVNGNEEIIIRSQECLEQLSKERPGDNFFINELNAILELN